MGSSDCEGSWDSFAGVFGVVGAPSALINIRLEAQFWLLRCEETQRREANADDSAGATVTKAMITFKIEASMLARSRCLSSDAMQLDKLTQRRYPMGEVPAGVGGGRGVANPAISRFSKNFKGRRNEKNCGE